ncbi:beta-1,4-mannosyl-glycoprotein 4-beta-N-acetylglucosaminyltransferase-like isoform X2 [Oratosquilla oratoria]|uniref:beta-1,4-mannosyl-glycoprotein 4-beta-N-acetylglucosaminyltransferase-like isoform X2 n=1 Tax=Oratosquilla oratoria TaxID=337810 RepID=UPI003F75E308
MLHLHQIKRVMMGFKRKIPIKIIGFTGILTVTILVLHTTINITPLQTNYSIIQNSVSEGVDFLRNIRLSPQYKSSQTLLIDGENENSKQDSKKLSDVKHEKNYAESARLVEDHKASGEVEKALINQKASAELTHVVKDENPSVEVGKGERTTVQSTELIKDKQPNVESINAMKDQQMTVGSTKPEADRTRVSLALPKDENEKTKPATGFVRCNKDTKEVFSFEKDSQKYFEGLGHGLECFIRGTNRTATLEKLKENGKGKKHHATTCSCLPNYYGDLCSIPAAVWLGCPEHIKILIKKRSQPRRIINGLPFHHELDMLEARLDEIGDVTDAFIVTESNYTAFGDPKPLWLLEKLNHAYMSKIQKKIMYILLDWFPEGGKEDGWVADGFSREYLGRWGLSCLRDLRDDDIFVLSDADELPSKEVITFLKLHEGFPEPISLSLRWTVFGFFWRPQPDDKQVTTRKSVVTVKTLREFLDKNAYKIRAGRSFDNPPQEQGFWPWNIGVINHYGGWHCSWCFNAQGIAQKLDAAQSDDGPRWGNYPEKKSIPYIKKLVREGRKSRRLARDAE